MQTSSATILTLVATASIIGVANRVADTSNITTPTPIATSANSWQTTIGNNFVPPSMLPNATQAEDICGKKHDPDTIPDSTTMAAVNSSAGNLLTATTTTVNVTDSSPPPSSAAARSVGASVRLGAAVAIAASVACKAQERRLDALLL